MERKSAGASPKNAAEPSRVDEMDIGILQRGDGMLPIVGLGGSAGGIAALQEFFAAMPVDSGMAFVVILHLSPTHESTLAEMFQRSTSMPVVVATDGAAVMPNSVYVIPPGKFLASVNGHLCLTEAEEHRGKRVAVDYFFRTLAETHGAQSLAVVLSGMGGDGALGLKRVKELGGLTIAQDPDEAEHPEMPRSAIATGVVDWVLAVKEMPAKLLAYLKQRGELKLPGEDGPHPAAAVELSPDEHEAALRDVLAFLHTRTGRDFSCYKRATILRRIARRMQVNGLTDLPGYLVYLRTHTGEAAALLQDLLISVTNFFRDPASFAALELTIPELFKGKEAGDTVRVWVAGCATGEEAYSIAMLLSEHAGTLVGPPQLQVFATDLDENVIREAREGLYPETITADVSEERLRHFFIHEQGGYRVRRAVRELVLFAPHDLLKDSPFSRLDLVSCRNLLIYLNREAQTRALDIFHFALRPGGRLFLGTSEAVDDGSPLFAVLDKKQRLYVQRPVPKRLIAVPTGPGTLARALSLQERMRERPTIPGRVTVESVQSVPDLAVPFDGGLPPGELHYRLIERFSPPSILVNAAHEIVHLSESAGRFLQFTGGEPTRNLLRTVHPMLRVELRAALYAAAQTHTVATAFRVPLERGNAPSLVDIRVTPAGDLAADFLLVVFEEHPADGAVAVAIPKSADADQAALHLERELVATKAHLRETIEQSEASTEELKASNEELQAMNEELRSATEELETSREELQSINEELTTVNDELKSNVDQLARSNNDLQNLMAATDIATIFLDRELNIQRFTPSAKTLFNFISTDLGRPLSDLSRMLDYPQIVADAERSLAHLQPAQREVSAGDRWYLARTLPYRTADDHIAGVVLTFLDITEQKQAEEEIARLAADSERQRRVYETVLTNTPDFVYVFSLDHRVLYANDALIKMWGRGREGAIGKTFLEIGYEPWHAEMHDREIDQVRATRQPIRGEVPFNGTNGRRIYDYIFVPVLGTDGEVEAVAGTTRDVTERKETERQLREGQQQLDFALAAADLGYWSLNLTDHTARRTLRHDQLFGYDALLPEWTYETFLEHVVADDRAAVDAAFQEAVATGSPWATECRIRRADGAVRHIWTKALIRRDADGQVQWMLGIVGDVTERRQAEARQAYLVRLADTLRPLSDAIDVQAKASQMLGEHLRANRVVYFEIRGDDYVIERDYSAGVRSLVGRYPVAAFGPAELTALLEGRTVIEADATTEPDRPPDERAAFAAIQVRGHVDVPLVKDGGFVAGMTVQVSEPRDWTRQEISLIEETAERTWSAVERVRAQSALRQSEERLRMALSSARMVAWEYDPASGAVVTSDNATDVYGFPSGEGMGSIDRGFAMLHPDDVDRHRAAVVAAVAAGEGFTSQFRIIRPDNGAVQWMEEWGHAVRDGSGEAVRLVGVNMDITARKRAEETLRSSEQRLRVAVAAAKLSQWSLDLLTREMTCSEGCKANYGRRPDEGFSYDDLWATVHPDDRDRVQAAVKRAVEDHTDYDTEYRTVWPDGTLHWVIVRGLTLYAPDGTPLVMTGVTLDITDRKVAEETLRASEERSAFVSRSAGVGFWYCDLPFDVLQWDELVKAHFHLPPDAAVTIQTFYDRIHPDDREPTRLAIDRSIADRTAYNVDYRTVDPDTGLVKWVRAIGRTAYAADGTPTRFDGVTLDVSEQKRAEASLRESEQRFRLVADAAPVLIWLSGTDKMCYWVNQPWLAFTGRSMEQEVGNGWAEGVHPDDFDRCLQTYIAAFDARKPFSMEYRLRRHDGEFRWLIDSGVPRYGPGGVFDGYIGSCLDVTDYKNAQAGLQDADRRKDEFLATLSHEMRTPLGAIIGWISILRQEGCDVEDLKEGLDAIDRNSKAQVKLIEDVLDVSRIVNGKLRLEMKPCEMGGIIQAAVDTVRPTANLRDITLQTKLDPAASKISCDEVRMQQVLWNLLSNALKFTPKGGTVTVTLERERSNIRIQVKDNGQGMGSDLLPYVFERFRQADSSSKRKFGGLGLGLSIVKHIVEAHGGTVRAESEGEGKGSTFIVLLPIRAVRLEEDSMAPATPGRGSAVELRKTETLGSLSLVRLDGTRVLLVDDEADARRLLERVLEQAGAKVLLASSAREALDILSKQTPEVLISDLGMPEEDGLDLIRQVRGRGLHPRELPAVALTAFASEDDQHAALSAGFQIHVAKPVDPHDLTTVIASLTGRTK